MKRFFATMLALLMVVGMLPMAVFASDANVAYIGETGYTTLAAAVSAATGETTIRLADGVHTMIGISDKNITFTGTQDAVIKIATSGIGCHGSTIKFDGITVKFEDNASYTGLQHTAKVVYENCTILGTQFLYAPTVEFTNCTFTNMTDAYCVWTYGAKDVTFKDCTFNTGGKAILVYTEGETTATIRVLDCTFISDGSAATDKAAVEVGESAYGSKANYTIIIENSTADGFVPNHSNTPLLGNKNDMPADRLEAEIDGVDASAGQLLHHYLTFVVNGGSDIDKIYAVHGTSFDLRNIVPERYGYNFTGWYTDPALKNPITSLELNKDYTLYAGWAMTSSYRYGSFMSDLVMLFNQTYTIPVTATVGGSVTADKANSTVKYDRNLTYTITPDEGYEIASVIVDGVDVGPVTSYTFKRVKEKGHTIEVTFAPIAEAAPAEAAE